MNAAVLAIFVLLPSAIGPLPQAPATMVLSICSGTGNRALEVPIPGRQPDMPEPCPAKACHAGCNRKQIDPSQ